MKPHTANFFEFGKSQEAVVLSRTGRVNFGGVDALEADSQAVNIAEGMSSLFVDIRVCHHFCTNTANVFYHFSIEQPESIAVGTASQLPLHVQIHPTPQNNGFTIIHKWIRDRRFSRTPLDDRSGNQAIIRCADTRELEPVFTGMQVW